MAEVSVDRGVVTVTMKLTGDEASFLLTLLGSHVLGSGVRNTLSSPIYQALSDAGVTPLFPWTGRGEVRF